MKTQLSKPARHRARYTEEYQKGSAGVVAQQRSLCTVSANLLTRVCCAAPRRPESLPGAARRAIRCRLSKTQAQGLMNI